MERFNQALLTCLLNSIWQIALITSVGACGAWLLRDVAARWRHLLWVATLTMCLCLPLMSAYRSWRGSALNLAEPRSEIAAGELSVELNTDVDRQITPVQESGYVLSIDRNSATGLVALYLLLIGICAARLFTAWMRARDCARRVRNSSIRSATTILHRCQTALGLKARPKLCAAAIPVPITVGSLKPLIVLPDRLLLEDDGDVVTSAIGHELVHIRRRDYAFNLIYELIHLPLSFHPAAALIRRRIRETRELSCDEMVADRLLDADTYARSLVRLAGVAMEVDRRKTITVGLADADILEERVMKILNRPGTNLLKANCCL
jgi:beta-lactamase regulating signal transducer with metallopeptidase domain